MANSFKTGGMCLAGRELTADGYGGWIRPVSDRPAEELNRTECQYVDRTSPKLLDIVEIAFLRPKPNGHQVENHLIDSSRHWIRRGALSFLALEELLEYPDSLWTNSGQTTSGLLNCLTRNEARKHRGSLYLVEGCNVAVWVGAGRKGNKSFYGVFQLQGHVYKLSVTDPALRVYFESFPNGTYPLPNHHDAFLCISLTEPYEWDNRCHKLIAGVVTWPPL